MPALVDSPSNSNVELPSTDSKHFSIDLTLELERQLHEMEGSPPPTPSASASADSQLSSNHHLNRESLDPHILAHIITQLRRTVEDMTKERGDLLKLLEAATTREASLQDTLQLMTEKATDYEEELSAAKKKMKEDEEAILLLRNKVEESRRGLMRLQTESRRQSVAPNSLDLSRAGIPTFSSPPSSKRASFTPLTGRQNGHRRVSSISVDGNGLGALHMPDTNPSPNNPNFTTFSEAPASSASGPLQSSRRSLFAKYSPPNTEVPLPSMMHITPLEMETLKKELDSLKKELSDTRAELAEATEGKEASEMCVKALRDFIAENQVGAGTPGGTSARPPPSMMGGDDPDSDRRAAAAASSGWGFRLWKADASRAPLVTNSAGPSSTSVQPLSNASAPLSRKLGGFFSSRASISSTTSQISSTTPVLQTNSAMSTDSNARDSSVVSGHSVSLSDTSSFIEPISPPYESHHGNVKIAGEAVRTPLDKESDADISISVQSVDDVRPGSIVG